MKTPQHTNNYWTIEPAPYTSGKPIYITAGKQGFVIATVTNQSISNFIGNEKEAQANAKLISAAPDLLKAVQYMKDRLLFYESNYHIGISPTPETLNEMILDLREVINKAV
jgi:hypothetical protein